MKTVQINKEALVAEILAQKSAELTNNKQTITTHCSGCGHCKNSF